MSNHSEPASQRHWCTPHSLVGQGSNYGVDQQLYKCLGRKHEAHLDGLAHELFVQLLLLQIVADIVEPRRRDFDSIPRSRRFPTRRIRSGGWGCLGYLGQGSVRVSNVIEELGDNGH